MKLEIIKIPGFMDVNSAILTVNGKRYAFDPWGTAKDWPNIDTVFVTHGHFDHIIGLAGMNVPWYMHPADNELFEGQRAYLASLGRNITTNPIDLLNAYSNKDSIIHHPSSFILHPFRNSRTFCRRRLLLLPRDFLPPCGAGKS